MSVTDFAWGPEIKVDGVRPEWLKDYDVWQWRIARDPHFKDGIAPSEYEKARTFGLIEAIRLPANHPHYTTPTPDERAVAPELVSRLVELVEKMSVEDFAQAWREWRNEARAIVAALEPVDPDKEIIDAMARAMWDNVGLFDPNLDTMRECAEYALQAYRQLEKEGK